MLNIYVHISTTAYQQSFYPRTLNQWNSLPNSIISTEEFVRALHSNYS